MDDFVFFFSEKICLKKMFTLIFAVPKTGMVLKMNRFGLVVQLVRMPPCHGGGRGFESRPVREIAIAKVLEAQQDRCASCI
jgi:hypothetical protein